MLLPELDGLGVLKTVRAESTTPVIMLTARTEELDKLFALELGSDDYVTKPFRPREVIARVRAVLRRSQPGTQALPLRVCTLEFDPLRASVQIGEQALRLTATEFRLLHHLAGSSGRIFNRAELLGAALPESEALERERQTLIADIAHELRTPPTILQGQLDAMQDGIVPFTERELGKLNTRTELLARLIDDLRTLSLADAKRLTLERVPIDLVALARRVCESFREKRRSGRG